MLLINIKNFNNLFTTQIFLDLFFCSPMLNCELIRTDKAEAEMLFENWFTIKILNTDTNRVLAEIKKLFGCPPSFVKQVKKAGNENHILVCKKNKNCDSVEYNSILNKLNQINNTKILNLTISEIPKWKALTFKQYERSNTVWPCYNYVISDKNHEIYTFCYNLVLKGKINDVCSSYCVFYNPVISKIVYEGKDEDILFGHCIFKGVEHISFYTEDYLCTNLVLYILNEPCIACAMALVHGRIKNVFFANEKSPFSFSKLKINSRENINHRFDVFKIGNGDIVKK